MKNRIDIAWLVQVYGHCVPRNQTVTGPQLAAEIRRIYSNHPRNEAAAQAVEQLEGVFTSGRCTVSYGPKPYGFEPKAILKAINRYCRRRRIFEGGLQWGYDYATWSVCYPQMAREFNRAAEAIMGRPGRYLPIIR